MLLGRKCQGEATDRQNLEGWKEGRKEGRDFVGEIYSHTK
jgi:hypothetical protein